MFITTLRTPALWIVFVLVSGVAQAGGVAPAEMTWDQDSWREVIGDDCRAFFDGCNNCRRSQNDSSIAACTRKACAEYREPRCLDAEMQSSASGSAAKTVTYDCAGGNRVSVHYHEYRRDDQRVSLSDSEIMFRDHQTRTVHKLQREVSASGAKYAGGDDLVFFAKGDEAFVQLQQERLYGDCRAQE